jgi:SEC-C motif domain protein
MFSQSRQRFDGAPFAEPTILAAPCRCHSQLAYAVCCAPAHAGASSASTAVKLMRSRYSAYALHLADYLFDTLDSRHPDRQASRAEFKARSVSKGITYTNLAIWEADEDLASPEVLFYAELRAKTEDMSFAELSYFSKHNGKLYYHDGILLSKSQLPKPLHSLSRKAFLDLAVENQNSP